MLIEFYELTPSEEHKALELMVYAKNADEIDATERVVGLLGGICTDIINLINERMIARRESTFKQKRRSKRRWWLQADIIARDADIADFLVNMLFKVCDSVIKMYASFNGATLKEDEQCD